MRSVQFLRLPACLLVAVLLAACSGGGGGGGGGETAPTGPVIASAADFWVDAAGSEWTLDGTDNRSGSPVQYRDRVTLANPMSLAGRTLVPFNANRPFNDFPETQYRSHDSSEGIRAWLEVLPTSLTHSYIELPAQIRVGSYRAYEASEAIPGGSITVRIDVNVIGFEALTMPGVASAAQALKTIHTFTATATANGQSASASTSLTLWYIRGLGVVKQRFVDPAMPSPNNSVTEELAGAITPTLRTGVVGDFDLLTGLAATSSTMNIGRPGVASDGSGYLVAARSVDSSLYAHLVATYVDANGHPVWTQTVVQDFGFGSVFDEFGPIAVTWDGESFWVVAYKDLPTSGSPGLVRQRVRPDGTLLDGPAGVTIGGGIWPALTSDGSNVLAVYGRNLGWPTFDYVLSATLFARDGSIVAAERDLATIGSGSSGFAAATFNGGTYLVAFEHGDPRDISMLRLDSLAASLDLSPLALSSAAQSQGNVALSRWGNGFAALWIDGRNQSTMSFPERDIYGTRVGSNGVLIDGDAATGGVPLDLVPSSRFGTAAATNAQHGLLVWTAGAYPVAGSPTPGIFGHFLDAGGPLDTSSGYSPDRRLGSLSGASVSARLMAPAAASNGSNFLVVWAEIESTQSVRGAIVQPRLELP